MAKVPFSTIVRLMTTEHRCLSVIAVMIDGVETYRFLDQSMRLVVDEYFEAYGRELQRNYKPAQILETMKNA